MRARTGHTTEEVGGMLYRGVGSDARRAGSALPD